jgi:hypothetical protein
MLIVRNSIEESSPLISQRPPFRCLHELIALQRERAP